MHAKCAEELGYRFSLQQLVSPGVGNAAGTYFHTSQVSICAALAGVKIFDSSKLEQQDGVWLVQVSSLRFGPLSSGPLPVDCSVPWRELPKGGVGINTNYLMDISPEWRSPGGPTYLESLKVLHASLYS